ncbi:hypothetical protein BDP27DRAFT_1340702, partial [Rhodocollybia butyracea]
MFWMRWKRRWNLPFPRLCILDSGFTRTLVFFKIFWRRLCQCKSVHFCCSQARRAKLLSRDNFSNNLYAVTNSRHIMCAGSVQDMSNWHFDAES